MCPQPRRWWSTIMRERILQVAAEHFVQRGYEGASMREIAADCGITKAALYYHFDSKSALLTEVFNDYLEQLGVAIASNPAPQQGAEEHLRAVIRALFAVPQQRRSLMRLAIHDSGHLEPEQRAEFGRAYHDRFLAPLRQIFADGIDSGELRAGDPDFYMKVLLGMLYPFFAPGGPVVDKDGSTEIDSLADVLFIGIRDGSRSQQ